jgi:transposase
MTIRTMNKTKKQMSAPDAAPQSKRYDEAFKRQAVEHWLRGGKSGPVIARELGVSAPTLKEWKRRYAGEAEPSHPSLEEENRVLKAELARVREQRDILKKSLGILCETPAPATSGSKR